MKIPNLIFGKIAVRKGFCTQEEVDKALSELCKCDKDDKACIGDLLKDKCSLTDEQVKEVLDVQCKTISDRDNKLFGQLALSNDFCTEDDLAECLAEQEKIRDPKKVPPIGELLLLKGMISEQERDALLVTQRRLNDPEYWRYLESDWQRTQEH